MVGRSLFSTEFGQGVPGDGIEFWKGFYQSLRPTRMGLSLNVGVDLVCFIFLRSRPYQATGETTSVVRYFQEKYNTRLRYPYFSAIQAGNDAKPTYLPMEICRLAVGQRYAMKLNERQTIQSNNYNKDKLVSDDFGLRVREQLTSIVARVLPPPQLKYHGSDASSEVAPSVGQWNMINLKMVNGGTVNYWAIVNFSRQRPDAVERFCKGLVSMFSIRNLLLPHSIEKELVDIQAECAAKLAAEVAPGKQLQLLFVILPEAKGTYGKLIFHRHHLMKISQQYFENVALKINVKVGGRNTVLAAALNNRLLYISDRPTIIFGADVTHPSPGEDSSPSIAAVVVSMDWPQVSKYKALVSAQPHRQEIIQDLYSTYTDSKRGVVHAGLIRYLLKVLIQFGVKRLLLLIPSINLFCRELLISFRKIHWA
ncbi:hypothetical protein OSB04_013365 [Centaurea solstitialis]|uniref:Piwi domain-containing protein n=1 Tax=Centaurea solstitialis TaxID=347529 RepID=A0AA38TR21_9ASTR|nr:hypothetical protein OSB04_013365 [Centaurea solstitialis]